MSEEEVKHHLREMREYAAMARLFMGVGEHLLAYICCEIALIHARLAALERMMNE